MAYPLLRETVPASAHWAYRNLRGQHHVIHSVIHRKQGVGLGVSMCFRSCVPVSAADLAILGTRAGWQPPKRTCFCVSKGKFRVYLRTQICACYEARDFLVPTLTTFQRKRVHASSRRTWQYAYLFLRGGSPAACGCISTSLRPGLANSELSSLKPTREDAVCWGLVAPRSDPRTCFCG